MPCTCFRQLLIGLRRGLQDQVHADQREEIEARTLGLLLSHAIDASELRIPQGRSASGPSPPRVLLIFEACACAALRYYRGAQGIILCRSLEAFEPPMAEATTALKEAPLST